jgi:hypothetical protein
VKIGDIFKTLSGGTPSKSKAEYYDGGTIPWLGSGELAQGEITTAKNYIILDQSSSLRYLAKSRKGLAGISVCCFPWIKK